MCRVHTDNFLYVAKIFIIQNWSNCVYEQIARVVGFRIPMISKTNCSFRTLMTNYCIFYSPKLKSNKLIV